MAERQPSTDQIFAHGALRVALVAAGVILALSTLYVAPQLGTSRAANAANSGGAAQAGTSDQGANPGADTSGGNNTGNTVSGPGNNRNGNGGAPSPSGNPNDAPPPGLTCSGNNGSATDTGVDKHTIHLAATEVESGVGQSFLGPVRFGMRAVLEKTNRAGGICGRTLDLTLRDDGWDPQTGKQYIDNFIDGHQYFALAVVPSSEGLNAASQGGDVDKASIPVVGSDGMLNSQYTDPWIWPVAASTATTMRIMAHDAITRGKGLGRPVRLGIIYDQNYRFGPEGAGAFVAEARREGATVDTSNCAVAVTAGQSGYGTQVKSFNDNCGDGASGQVDFVALLLEPETAETWLSNGPYLGHTKDGSGLGFGGPQPLFDKNFADTCGATCTGMEVWTSFFPPVDPFDQGKVQAFQADLCAVDSSCTVDARSAFTESGYVGMGLLVTALQQTSPYLTRTRLAATLDSMTGATAYNSGLTPAPLAFRSGYHYSNQTMVAFQDSYSSTSSFQYIRGSQQADPCKGCQDKPLS